MKDDIKRWINNPWVVAVITGFILLCIPTVGNQVLTWSGKVWNGALDTAYKEAPVAVTIDAFRAAGFPIILFLTMMLLLLFYISGLVLQTLMMLALLYFAFSGTWHVVLERRAADAAATFERRMMVLTPAFSDAEHRALIGKWGAVRTKANFDAIMEDMEGLAKKYGITLPARTDQ